MSGRFICLTEVRLGHVLFTNVGSRLAQVQFVHSISSSGGLGLSPSGSGLFSSDLLGLAGLSRHLGLGHLNLFNSSAKCLISTRPFRSTRWCSSTTQPDVPMNLWIVLAGFGTGVG